MLKLNYGRIVVSAHMAKKGEHTRWDLDELALQLGHHSAGEPLAIRPAVGVLLMLHAEGRLVILGELTLEQCIEHADALAAQVQGEASQFKIESITGHCLLPQAPDLHQLQAALGERCHGYDPHSFKGLLLKLDNTLMAFIIFESGRIMCIGARSHADLHNGFRRALALIISASPPV